MDEAAVLRYVTDSFPGVHPLSAAGDTYFLYDPDRNLPPNRQHPFATLVTGDRHDQVSQLDRPGVFRLNIGVRKQTYRDLFGRPPTERGDGGVLDPGRDYAVLDMLLPHPVYASQYWVCVLVRRGGDVRDDGATAARRGLPAGRAQVREPGRPPGGLTGGRRAADVLTAPASRRAGRAT